MVMLLVQAGDDTAAARRGAGAIFVVIRLACAARIRGLCKSGSRRPDGEYENGKA
jgi:hypothetical protein